jgi:hypothetical protein
MCVKIIFLGFFFFCGAGDLIQGLMHSKQVQYLCTTSSDFQPDFNS